MDKNIGDSRELGKERPHLAGAQCAVKTNAERARVPDCDPECVEGLPRKRSAAPVRNRDRNHEGDTHAAFFEYLFDSNERGLGIQGVEDGFDEKDVNAAVQQSSDLFAIRFADLVEGGGAIGRVVHQGRC